MKERYPLRYLIPVLIALCLLGGAERAGGQTVIEGDYPFIRLPRGYTLLPGEKVTLVPLITSSHDRIEWLVNGSSVASGDTYTYTAASYSVNITAVIWRGSLSSRSVCRILVRPFSITTGGNNDGYMYSTPSPKVPEPVRLMTGGNGDGFTTTSYMPVPVPERLMTGGNGDGFAEVSYMPAPVPERIMAGGNGDGYAATPEPDPEAQVAIVNGGNGDGYARSCEKATVCFNEMDLTECVGVKITAESDDPNATYLWQKYNTATGQFETVPSRAGISGITSRVFTIDRRTEADYGLYRCQVTNACGSGYGDIFSVTKDGTPEFRSKLNRDWAQCENSGSVDMAVMVYGVNADNRISYTWYKNGTLLPGENREGITVPVGSQAATEGWYKVVAANSCGSVADSTYLPVWQSARVRSYAREVTGCDGGRAEFTMEVEGGGTYRISLWEVEVTGTVGGHAAYRWLTPVGDDGNRVVLNGIDASYEGKTYAWKLSNECGNDSSGIVTLHVAYPPRIVSQTDSPQEVCPGMALTLTCRTAENLPGYVYRWYKNDEEYGEGAELHFASVTEQDAGFYRCEVSNRGCTDQVSSAPVELKMKGGPQISSVVTPGDYNFCTGSRFTLRGTLVGEDPVNRWQWFKNGSPLIEEPGRLSGTTGPVLHFDSLAGGDAGNYTLAAYNHCGSTVTRPYALKIDYPAVFVHRLSAQPDMKICMGDDLTLQVEAEGTEPVMYMWTHNGVKVAEGYTNSIRLTNVTVDTNGIYCCEIHNKCGGAALDCAPLEVQVPDTFRLTGDGAYCAGSAQGVVLQLEGSDSTCTYRLYRNGSVVQTVDASLVEPKGGPVVFPPVFDGIYYAEVTDENCVRRMPGEIEVKAQPLPEKYTLEISRYFCEGSEGAQLKLSGSQPDVVYRMYVLTGEIWTSYGLPQEGTGAALLYENVRTGRYKVVAEDVRTGCVLEMNGRPEVIRYPLPAVPVLQTLSGDTLYCAESEGVTVQLERAGDSCRYRLVRDGSDTLLPVSQSLWRWEDCKAGQYRVWAESERGCVSGSPELQVRELNGPAAYTLEGGGVYCREGEGTFRVTLPQSEKGVNYYFYRMPDHLLARQAGSGTALTVEVPAEEYAYYVKAEDTTRFRCRTSMRDTVEVRANRLKVTGDPGSYRIDYNTRAELKVKVEGGPATSYLWAPDSLLEAVNVASPLTLPLKHGNLFKVEVENEGGCKAEAVLEVLVTGGPLTARILNDRKQPVDTLYVCGSEEFGLYGWRDGGSGSAPYEIRWYDGADSIGRAQELTYRKDTSGYLYFRVMRGDMSAADSVWIECREPVYPYSLTNAGLNCTPTGTQEVRIANSQNGVHYFLEYSAECNGSAVVVAEAEGHTGQAVVLNIAEIDGHYGCYRVRGEKSYAGHQCVVYMEGKVEFRPRSQVYAVSGDRTYCEGSGTEDVIYVSGSEAEAGYELLRDGYYVTTRPGTGGPLEIRGHFGSGHYTVNAVNNGCRTAMSGAAEIRVNTLPEDQAFTMGGYYCRNQCPVAVELEGTEPGVTYTLYRDSAGIVSAEGNLWPGETKFGDFCASGRYYVKAAREDCGVILDHFVEIDVGSRTFQLTGEEWMCYGSDGVVLGLDGSEPGKQYILQYWNEEIGIFVNHDLSLQEGDGHPIVFPGLYKVGTYRAATLCGDPMEGVITVKERDPIQEDMALTLAGNLCADSVIGVRFPTERGVRYGLWKGTDPVPETGLTGNGLVQGFVFQGERGDYRIRAERDGCVVTLQERISVDTLPVLPVLGGADALCSGMTGNVKLVTGYIPDYTYRLLPANGAVAYEGTVFGGDYLFKDVPVDDYRVEVSNAGCKAVGAGYSIREIPLPQVPREVFQVTHCVEEGEGEIRLTGMADTLIYIFSGASQKFPVEIDGGSGDKVFEHQPFGLYRLMIRDPQTGCVSEPLWDTIRESAGRAYLLGDSVYCEGLPGARLRVSGITLGVSYLMLDEGENVLERVDNTVSFLKDYPEGKYIFRKERTGAGGGCVEDMEWKVRQVEGPRVFTLQNVCDDQGEVHTIDGSEGDSVEYHLYRNGEFLTSQQGTGGELSFGIQTQPGIYRVQALKNNSCIGRMADSVFIHKPLPDCGLVAVGEPCASGSFGAELYYDCSEPEWQYLLSDTANHSEQKAGTGGTLQWNEIEGQLILPGTYLLQISVGCKTLSADTLQLEGKVVMPQQVEGDTVLCEETEGLNMYLPVSETGVLYRLIKTDGDGFPEVEGTGGRLLLNSSPVREAGEYKVYGYYAGSRCENEIAAFRVVNGATPARQLVRGEDVCLTGGMTGSVELCLPVVEEKVKYILAVQQEQLLEKAELSSGSYCFLPQTETGVYWVIAEHEDSHCRRVMEGRYAIGPPPRVYMLEDDGDTLKVCSGKGGKLRLSESDIGVKYRLMRNAVFAGKEIYGTGHPIAFEDIRESGVYTVVAENGCTEPMSGEVTLQVVEVPELYTPSVYYYCGEESGATVAVYRTQPDVTYSLFTPGGSLLSRSAGGADTLKLEGLYTGGAYLLQASAGTTGCTVEKNIRVEHDDFPQPFRFYGTTGEYVCVAENDMMLMLAKSETGVDYTLYRESLTLPPFEFEGNGRGMTLETDVRAGTYVLEARKHLSGCRIADTLTLWQADSLQMDTVLPVKTVYCYREEGRGEVRLSGSHPRLTYELYADGQPAGYIQKGGAAGVNWTNVKGKKCADCKDDTDGTVYTVWATDTLSGCRRKMQGEVKILEEAEVTVYQFHPNRAFYVCEGHPVEFAVVAAGCNLKYNWYRIDREGNENVLISSDSVNQSYYRVASAGPGEYGLYWCEVQNRCDTLPTEKVQVEVRQSVYQTRRMRDTSVCRTQLQSLTLNAYVQHALHYEWYKRGAEGIRYTVRNFEVTDPEDAEYICHAWNECNEIYDTCRVEVDPEPELTLVKGETDTLCAGSRFEIEVQANDELQWFRNGDSLSYVGKHLILDPVKATDEGGYAVALVNACGARRLPVLNLYVDEPVRVKKILPADSFAVCRGDEVELRVETYPEKRVEYTWTYGPDSLGHQPALLLGAADSLQALYPYVLHVRNVCNSIAGSGAVDSVSIRLKVHPPLRVSDPLREIIVCAQPYRDTVLRIPDPDPDCEYRWHYFNSRRDTVALYPFADTLKVNLTTSQTGYYFCRVYNACGVMPTNSCWVRVDSVPVPASLPPVKVLCEGDRLNLSLSATGGTLRYAWVMRRKDGQVDTIGRHFEVLYESSAVLNYGPLSAVHDSSQVWCYLYNGCGDTFSDTVLLRVHTAGEVEFLPDTVRFCEREEARVEVHLLKGGMPWSYTYTRDGREEKTVADLSRERDTLTITQGGIYRIIRLKNEGGCVMTRGLPQLVAEEEKIARIYFTGTAAYCEGEEATLTLHKEGPDNGPWQISILRESDSEDALELCPSYPLTIYGNDTTLTFYPVENEVYYLHRSITAGCGADLVDNRVEITVNKVEHVEFAAGWAPYVGSCRNVDLRKMLQPSVQGILLEKGDPGRFYVNGQELSGDVWRKGEMAEDSCYRVVYRYLDSRDCPVTSDEIRLCVDGLPAGAVLSSGIACESVANYFRLQLSPAGRVDSVVIRQGRHKKREEADARPKYTLLTYGRSLLPADGFLQIPLNWDEVGGVDSCMTFEVLYMWDTHGCGMEYDIPLQTYDSLYRDTVWRHWDPVVEVKVRRSGREHWESGVHEVNLVRGDSVEVKVCLMKGMPLWSLPGLGIDTISGRDTVFWLKNEGTYNFVPRDVACGRQGPAPYFDLTITHLETGYFRGRLLLEGPYDEENGMMMPGHCRPDRLEESLKLPVDLPLLPPTLEVVDWMVVELRTGSKIDSVALMTDSAFLFTRDTCLLLSDGHIADRWTGDTIVGIRHTCGSGSNRRYVVVRHRNHLGVMTNRTYPFVTAEHRSEAVFIDFTDGRLLYSRDHDLSKHLTKMMDGSREFYLLSAGELNNNHLITLFDPNRITLEDLKPTQLEGDRYDLLYDINLDGCVDWPGWNGNGENSADWNIVKRNRQKFTEIKWIE